MIRSNGNQLAANGQCIASILLPLHTMNVYLLFITEIDCAPNFGSVRCIKLQEGDHFQTSHRSKQSHFVVPLPSMVCSGAMQMRELVLVDVSYSVGSEDNVDVAT